MVLFLDSTVLRCSLTGVFQWVSIIFYSVEVESVF